jgi:ergothioneine biosynthesis protein EgtB
MSSPAPAQPAAHAGDLAGFYARVRTDSVAIAAPLSAEDCQVQSMPDVSPTKWHLAHVTWFFEQFVLAGVPGYRVFHDRYGFLFNSYYYTVGDMHLRPRRGLLSRPSLDEILGYRSHVDEAMADLIQERGDDPKLAALVTLGLNHEQQHQELMLMDIKHVLSCNPLKPAYREGPGPGTALAPTLGFLPQPGGVQEIGAASECFTFDNETPRHRAWLDPFEIADRPVSNAEYRAFIDDGGYRNNELWLSDGWATVQKEGWDRPLYWEADLESEFTLHGLEPIDPGAPVCHLSYYEADAYARWAGARLPSEAEWEVVASAEPVAGRFADASRLHPAAAPAAGAGPGRMFGDVWQWTASGYAPYPGFRPLDGSLGEYNGKFMVSQMVLRGGACVTPAGHVRATYRNFFYPHQRWQFAGARLARNAG